MTEKSSERTMGEELKGNLTSFISHRVLRGLNELILI